MKSVKSGESVKMRRVYRVRRVCQVCLELKTFVVYRGKLKIVSPLRWEESGHSCSIHNKPRNRTTSPTTAAAMALHINMYTLNYSHKLFTINTLDCIASLIKLFSHILSFSNHPWVHGCTQHTCNTHAYALSHYVLPTSAVNTYAPLQYLVYITNG